MKRIWGRDEWLTRREAHWRRAEPFVVKAQERASVGRKDPIEDFLFRYYHLRPGELLHFHPGAGIGLYDAAEYINHAFYRLEEGIAFFDVEEFLARRGPTVERASLILRSTASRNAAFGCFGMHEWAMVYGLHPDQTRHAYLPLRLSPDDVKRVVNEVGVRCSHYDAYRFFTPDAAPLNRLRPTRENQPVMEQPGCLHANMDLYRWAGKLVGIVGSDLLLDTFILARDIRILDMRASAYDLVEWGYDPVRIETAGGRSEYARAQREFSLRAQDLRARLIATLDGVGVTAA